jgi:hypothetical protein
MGSAVGAREAKGGHDSYILSSTNIIGLPCWVQTMRRGGNLRLHGDCGNGNMDMNHVPFCLLFEGVPDNAMVHASPEPLGNLAGGVKPSTTGVSSWFLGGQDKHLTVPQSRNLVGAGGRGSVPNSDTFVFKLINSSNPTMFRPGPLWLGTYQEYNAAEVVVPETGGVVGPKG